MASIGGGMYIKLQTTLEKIMLNSHADLAELVYPFATACVGLYVVVVGIASPETGAASAKEISMPLAVGRRESRY